VLAVRDLSGIERARNSNADRAGFDYPHVAIDDHSRVAFVQARPDEWGETCAAFLADTTVFFPHHGITGVRGMTDNARPYRRSKTFRDVLLELGIAHRRTATYRRKGEGTERGPSAYERDIRLELVIKFSRSGNPALKAASSGTRGCPIDQACH
jgi:hypothetical protein